MATKILDMYGELTLRDQKYHAGLNAVRKESVGFVGELTGTYGQLQKVFAGVMGVMAVRKGIGFFESAIMSAADLNESINKVDKTFGPAAESVKKKVDDLADSFGLVKASTLDAAAGIGLMLRASGKQGDELGNLTNQLVQTAADTASLYNLSMEEALMKIRAGLAGEAEPLRTLGVLLSEDAVKAEAAGMGFQKMGKDFDQGAKVSARASLIMKGLGVASGDLADTFGSAKNQSRGLAGQMENLKAEVGQNLLGAYQAVTAAEIEAGKELASFARDHQEDIKKLADLIGTDLVNALKVFTAYLGSSSTGAMGLFKSLDAATPDWLKMALLTASPVASLRASLGALAAAVSPEPTPPPPEALKHAAFFSPKRDIEQPMDDAIKQLRAQRGLQNLGRGLGLIGASPVGQAAQGVAQAAFGQIAFGDNLQLQKKYEDLQKYEQSIKSLMPERAPSQLFTEGGSMEQQFQQAILNAGDPQVKELKDINKEIKDIKKELLKRARESYRSYQEQYARIAPANAARR